MFLNIRILYFNFKYKKFHDEITKYLHITIYICPMKSIVKIYFSTLNKILITGKKNINFIHKEISFYILLYTSKKDTIFKNIFTTTFFLTGIIIILLLFILF